MPTYEYECSKCGNSFERFQQMTDDPVDTCPECGGPVRRLIGTGGGFIFKGSGFYSTDYRKGACPSGKGSCESAKPSSDGDGHVCTGGCCGK